MDPGREFLRHAEQLRPAREQVVGPDGFNGAGFVDGALQDRRLHFRHIGLCRGQAGAVFLPVARVVSVAVPLVRLALFQKSHVAANGFDQVEDSTLDLHDDSLCDKLMDSHFR